MFDYVGELVTIYTAFSHANLTNLDYIPLILTDISEDPTNAYHWTIEDKIIADLGNSNIYYKNERCTLTLELHHNDTQSSTVNIELNMREIITELERISIAKNKTYPGYEITYDSSTLFGIQNNPVMDYIFTRWGVPQ